MYLDGYSNLSKLTKSTSTAVYQANQDSLDRTVAIRFLSPDLLMDAQARIFFDRESLVIARLNHPNIIKVIDRGITPKKHPYFVMEYVQGEDLDSIRTSRKPSLIAKSQLLMQTCKGLACAHKNNVLHRNIKPSNILIDKQGHVYILDVGIAWLEASGKSENEEVPGSSDYLSPEQLTEPAKVSHLSDIYSLGVLMYELFAGSLPSQHPDDLAEGLGSLPPPLIELILQCLQTRPESRPASADEVHFRLLKMLNGAHIKQSDQMEAIATIGPAADKFELLDVINRNFFGAVYLFDDKSRNILVVVKKRVKTHAGLREANQLKAIQHDNIIRVLGTSSKSQTFIVVMEYLNAGSLQDRLSRPFDLKRFLGVATGVSLAMQRAHKDNIIHGNLRPGNILFNRKGDAKVTDFGFSKHYTNNLKRDWYQPQSRQNASVKRDIYSAGAIFYHMLTGSPATVRYGQLTPEKGFSNLSAEIQSLLRNMIEMQSLSRLHSFDEVLDVLKTIQVDDVGVHEAPEKTSKSPRYRIALFALVSMLALLFVWLFN
jgi:serine/threonine-protein kinase